MHRKAGASGRCFYSGFRIEIEKLVPGHHGEDFRIDSMTADSTWSNPVDDIASIAPNLLKSDFKFNRQQWSRSPEAILSFQRRYNERRHRPGQTYEFEVFDGRVKAA